MKETFNGVTKKDVGRPWVFPNGGALKSYQPVDEFDRLFLTFAELKSANGVLNFIQTYGLLTRKEGKPHLADSVPKILEHAEIMRSILKRNKRHLKDDDIPESSGRRDGKEGGLSPRSRLHIHRILKSALKAAVQLQLLARNPADAVKSPKPARKEMKTLTAEEGARLLNVVSESRLYWPVLLALTTGMRRGEIVALRWKNVDLDKGVVRVVESIEQTKKGIRFKPPKNNKNRVITLPSFVIEELKLLKAEQAEELLKLGIRQNENALLCGRFDGQPLQPDSLTFSFAALIKNIEGFPRVRFHDLRHSHATQLLLSGVHPKVAQERLGHSSVTVTLDIYSHVTENMQNDAAARLDNVFRSAINAAAADLTVR